MFVQQPLPIGVWPWVRGLAYCLLMIGGPCIICMEVTVVCLICLLCIQYNILIYALPKLDMDKKIQQFRNSHQSLFQCQKP